MCRNLFLKIYGEAPEFKWFAMDRVLIDCQCHHNHSEVNNFPEIATIDYWNNENKLMSTEARVEDD